MASSIFAYVLRGKLIVPDNAADTARNIVAHEGLYRLSIAGDLITTAGVTGLITALYAVLRPVNRNLALFASCLRGLGASIYANALLNDLQALRVLSGAAYLRAFEPDRLQALARLAISQHGAMVNVDFVFLGMGSTVFCYLWLRSRYIPRALAALGVFGSSLLAAGSFALVIFPALGSALSLTYMLPLGLFEVTMGFLLLFRTLTPLAFQREA
jgi:hypothetical protein